jgi:hypothetical protein
VVDLMAKDLFLTIQMPIEHAVVAKVFHFKMTESDYGKIY